MFQAYLSAGSMFQILLVKNSSAFCSEFYNDVIKDAVRHFDFTETNAKISVEKHIKAHHTKKGSFL